MSHTGKDDGGEYLGYELDIVKQKGTFDIGRFDKRSGVTKEEVSKVDSRMDMIKETAKKHDTLYQRMQDYSDSAVNQSSWLQTQRIPGQKALGARMEEAANAIGIAHLSSSQRSKRGKKFRDKAKIQAEMVNISYECQWHRKAAIDDLMRHGKNARLGEEDSIHHYVNDFDGDFREDGFVVDRTKDTYLENVDENIDQKSTELRDIAFYYENQARYEKYDKTRSDKPFRYDVIENLADEKQRNEGYVEVLRDFERLELSKFDYKDNTEFINNDDKFFVRRYAELRAFSHVPDMLKSIKNSGTHPELKEKMLMYQAKAETVKEILADYEMRMIMLQSPYYTLLAGKDVGSFSDKEIKERMGKTEDPMIRAYLGRVLDKRAMDGFGRGKSAAKIYEQKLKALRSGKAEKKEPDLEEYVLSQSQIIYFRKDTTVVCKYPPFLYDKSLKSSELDDKAQEIMWLHRQLKVSFSNDRLMPDFLYRSIDEKLYESFVRHQQEIEHVGAQVRLLNDMKKKAYGKQADEIDDLIEKLAGSEAFGKLQKKYLEEADELEEKLKIWKKEHVEETGKMKKKLSTWNN